MPLFDYVCSNCNTTHKDVLVKTAHSEHYSPACPNCGKIGSLQRQPSKSAFSIHGYSAANGYSGGRNGSKS